MNSYLLLRLLYILIPTTAPFINPSNSKDDKLNNILHARRVTFEQMTSDLSHTSSWSKENIIFNSSKTQLFRLSTLHNLPFFFEESSYDLSFHKDSSFFSFQVFDLRLNNFSPFYMYFTGTIQNSLSSPVFHILSLSLDMHTFKCNDSVCMGH